MTFWVFPGVVLAVFGIPLFILLVEDYLWYDGSTPRRPAILSYIGSRCYARKGSLGGPLAMLLFSLWGWL